MKKIVIAAVLTLFVAEAADAAWFKRARHRDDDAIRVKNGEYNLGWHHTQDVHKVDYCYPVVQRQQDKARKKLARSGWLTIYVSNDQEVDWLWEGDGDSIQGENPCLKPGVQPGKQPRANSSGAEMASVSNPTSPSCRDCDRALGGVCALAHLTESLARRAAEGVLAAHTGKTENNYGIGAVLEAATAAAQTCREQP